MYNTSGRRPYHQFKLESQSESTDNYPIKNFEVIKELLLQMIQCVDIGNLEIRDMNLKESKREFIDILHELGHGYNEKEWHLLKYIES